MASAAAMPIDRDGPRARQARSHGQDLLRIEGLHIDARSEHGWSTIVHGVDLTVRRGEVVGLIGESGAGKSSIGLAAMGYARAGCRISAGRVDLLGHDLLRLSDRDRRAFWGCNVAYVAQSAAAAFNPAHRLMDQIVEQQVWHGVADAAGAARTGVDLFRRLHLPEPDTIGMRFPHQVSGGQLQRIITAMAMSCGPDLIVFDEPTTALDVTTQIEVLHAIKEAVREAHAAAIYISHDLAVVAQMAHRIVVLRHGQVVEEAPTRKMISAPEQPYTRSLWAVRSLHKPSEPPTETLLSVRNLHASYGRSLKVLEDVCVDVPRGRTVAIVGESGSGKSTLARVVAGLLPPMEGEVVFKGEALPRDYRRRSNDALQRIQLIYQMPDTALNPRRTVRDVLRRPLRRQMGLRGAALETRIREIMAMIELDDRLLGRRPSELSGGQKQRLCIARALAVEPDLILCDEVTSALDQLVAEGILKLLLRLQAELKVSYLFITHDLATVRAIADQIVVMHQGRVLDSGRKEDVLDGPHSPYTAKLLASVPEMDPEWLDRVRPPMRVAPE